MSTAKKEYLFKDFADFVEHMTGSLDSEVLAAEFSRFSKVQRANWNSLEYICASIYPANMFDRTVQLLALRLDGKVYYPIVGWNPDAKPSSPAADGQKISTMRRWLNRQPKRVLHSSRENRDYVLYG